MNTFMNTSEFISLLRSYEQMKWQLNRKMVEIARLEEIIENFKIELNFVPMTNEMVAYLGYFVATRDMTNISRKTARELLNKFFGVRVDPDEFSDAFDIVSKKANLEIRVTELQNIVSQNVDAFQTTIDDLHKEITCLKKNQDELALNIQNRLEKSETEKKFQIGDLVVYKDGRRKETFIVVAFENAPKNHIAIRYADPNTEYELWACYICPAEDFKHIENECKNECKMKKCNHLHDLKKLLIEIDVIRGTANKANFAIKIFEIVISCSRLIENTKFKDTVKHKLEEFSRVDFIGMTGVDLCKKYYNKLFGGHLNNCQCI